MNNRRANPLIKMLMTSACVGWEFMHVGVWRVGGQLYVGMKVACACAVSYTHLRAHET